MAKRIDLRKAVEAKAQQRRGRRGMISVFTKDPTRWEDNLFFMICFVMFCHFGRPISSGEKRPGANLHRLRLEELFALNECRQKGFGKDPS